jgi:thymidylate kinase
LHVVLLGPDGVGKSTVIDAMTELFTPIFAGGVAMDTPQGILRRPQAPTDRPHDKEPWGLFGSLAKAVYWFLYYTPGYYRIVYPALRQDRLHLSHRYLVDALVDAKRYRYSGPRWVLALLWRLAVKPDLVILLDASPETIQARKSEVTLEETARQCRAYRAVVARLPQGRIVDAGQPLAAVVADVRDAVLAHMASRTARRLKLQRTR